jgi:hypothetical protein
MIGAVETFEEQQQAASPDHHEENLPECMDEGTSVAGRAMMHSHLRQTLGTFTEVQVPFGVHAFRMEALEHFRASFGRMPLLRCCGWWRAHESALWRTDFVG